MKLDPLTFSRRFSPQILANLQGLQLKARYVMEGLLQGLHDSPFHGSSLEFCDFRRCQPGDDLRYMDWRLYARSDRMYIKRFMQETNVRFYILCDTSASMGYQGRAAWASKLDCAKLIAAVLIHLVLKQKDAAGLLTLGQPDQHPDFEPPSQRPSQFGLLLTKLDRLQARGNGSLPKLLEQASRWIQRRSVVLLFSDLLEPAEEIRLGLKSLKFHGHETIVCQVLDRDELEFPFSENQVFEDLETTERRNISGTVARTNYLQRFREFMASHHKLLSELEIPHCLFRTDQDPAGALAGLLSKRRQVT